MVGSALVMAWHMCFKMVVFPDLGGETIKPRCPFPTGAKRSMARVVHSESPDSKWIRGKGSTETRLKKCCSAGDISAGGFELGLRCIHGGTDRFPFDWE